MIHEVKTEQPAIVDKIAEVPHESIKKQRGIARQQPLPIKETRPGQCAAKWRGMGGGWMQGQRTLSHAFSMVYGHESA